MTTSSTTAADSTPVTTNKHSPDSVDQILLSGFQNIVAWISQDPKFSESDRANMQDTAVRAAKAFASMVAPAEQVQASLTEILSTSFPKEESSSNSPGMVCQGPIRVHSMCPHHLMLVEYEVFAAYIPASNGNILGLSKIARLVTTLAKRPVLQEQLACDIADVLCTVLGSESQRFKGIESQGSAVLLVGRHSCMSCRGVESDALTSTTEIRGLFHNPEMELKFYQSVNRLNESLLRR
jgi:GTP cyclohydrolase I